MIAGTLLLLDEPATDPLESKSSGGFATLDVRETQEYLDGSVVQEGRACDHVEGTNQEVYIDGSTIGTETTPVTERAYTEWVADVTDAGFIVTERTRSDEFPMGLFEVVTEEEITPALVDPGAFMAAQLDAGNNPDTWYTGSKTETERDDEPNDVDMGYGHVAGTARDARQANIGVGFKTGWQGKRIKGIIYSSGYLAIHNDSVGPIQFARFVREEIIPHAEAVEPDEEDDQSTLGESTDGKESGA